MDEAETISNYEVDSYHSGNANEYDSLTECPHTSHPCHVGKSCDMNVGKIWTHWELNSRPPECITWCAPPLHHMPVQSTFMFPGLPINRIYPLSTHTLTDISDSGCISAPVWYIT